jgi:DNA-binding PadR family transcriptional regulator
MSVRNAILGLLAYQPRHGYELRTAFEALVGGEAIWDVKPAQIYNTLTRLEEAGLIIRDGIEQDGGPEKRIYSLTPRGRAALVEWYTTGVAGNHHRDEFFLKLMLSLFGRQVSPYAVIRAQRNQLYQDLHESTARRNGINSRKELAQIFLLDKSIMHLEADLRWLDLLEARLDDIRQQPLPEPQVRPRGRPKKKKKKLQA